VCWTLLLGFNPDRFKAQGHAIKEVAKIIDLSPRTVESYLNNVKLKIGITKKSELIHFISKNGLLR
jgi:DNA-binding CsgD family transcriptional regulator